MRSLDGNTDRGLNRVVWNLRHESLPRAHNVERPRDPARADSGRGGFGFGGGRPGGPLVVPGTYTVRLNVEGDVHETTVDVGEDPRIQAPTDVRAAWTELQLELGELYSDINELVGEAIAHEESLEDGSDARAAAQLLREELAELRTRASSVRGSISGWVGPATADQRSTIEFCYSTLERLRTRWDAMATD